ncbi:PadR family transcriptional regulator [Paenibacillus sp. EC2-1]|uniref:PadR family transcriptional regulator n=1 Tax=Paenibacillus sp. EC2-1 TaxID=3388665 RepID=UPI003BEF30A3
MSLRVFILGNLCERNHHPYDVKKMLKGDNMEDVQKINDGRLYYNFEVLLKQGYIEKIEVTREENRPEKTTYGITEAGRKALEEEIYTAFKNFKDVKSLYSSTVFLKHADPVKLAFLIEEAIQKLQNAINRNVEDWKIIGLKTPLNVHLVQEHSLNYMELEVSFLKKLLAFVRGELTAL